MKQLIDLQGIIKIRRSTKPSAMNGEKISRELILQLLELADWAPNHGNTEPWRFFVYEAEGLKKFCADHANLYKKNTAEEQFTEAKFNTLQNLYQTLSHIMVVYVKKTEPTKIPFMEEYAAVAASIQNILLGAQASGISALWSTGGMTYNPAFKQYLGIEEADHVLGQLYLGYTDEAPREGKRKIPLEQKIIWHTQ